MKPDHFRIIHRDDLPLGGFAGIVETRMVMNPKLWPQAADNHAISHGLGGFIYMATGHFNPNDGAPLHPHKDVDIVTLVSSGEVGHDGTNGGGSVIKSPGVQIQRAGKGMQHSEFSNTDQKANFVQLWFTPPKQGLTPDYQNLPMENGGPLKTVLGGGDTGCFDNDTWVRIGYPAAEQTISVPTPSITFVFQGAATVNGTPAKAGDLIESASLDLVAGEGLGLILIIQTITTS